MRFTGVLAALGLIAAVALAGTVGTTCKDSIEMELNELYEGDTSVMPTTAISCNRYRYAPRGMWYHYKGTGSAVVLDTCDQRTAMDTVIFVFKSCTESHGFIDQCVAMDDDGCNQQQSRVTFTAEKNQDYFIYVAGYMNSSGIFYLATAPVLPPENYQCHNAITVNHYPFAATGETGTCLAVRDTCLNTMSSGLWYKVTGSGQPFVAHTCNSNTNYDSVIDVFSSCTEEQGADGCIATNNDACYRSSLVTWRSVQHSEYWILVTGYQNARGRFTLAIEQRSMNPYSHCNEPIVITALPFYYSGQTDYLETTFSECRNADNQHSMFFRFRGANRKVIATTCTSASTVNDSIIDVYTDCNSETGVPSKCVATNDDYCGLGAAVVFDTTVETYYIAVSSASPTLEGVSFSLAVMPYEEVINTQCWYATEVESLPEDFVGTTRGRATTTQSCDGSKVQRRGAWYRYTHDDADAVMTATTCNPQNILNARLEVYEDCNDMRCTAQVDPDPEKNCTTATFTARKGSTYNVFVTAADIKDPGSFFHVDFYRETPSTHGQCEDAYFVNRGQLPYRLQDNTMKAEDSYSSCDNRTKKGIWVAVIGSGHKFVATTCDSHTGYDTVLELYNRCPDQDHPGEYCVKTNDDSPSCNRASEIEFETQPGAYYWIFVTGFASSSGIFVLNIYEKVSMINAQCHNAVGIRTLPYYDYGLTTYCDMSNASCRKTPRKGNWYEFIGNDHWVTISTCNVETNFATEIEVYLACNDHGGDICVNHNHDYGCSPKTQITFAAVKDQLFYIFVTGVDEAVMAEGFFGITVTQGEKLPHAPSGQSSVLPPPPHGMSGFGKFMVGAGIVACGGVVAAICAFGYAFYRKRHVAYQEIVSSE